MDPKCEAVAVGAAVIGMFYVEDLIFKLDMEKYDKKLEYILMIFRLFGHC